MRFIISLLVVGVLTVGLACQKSAAAKSPEIVSDDGVNRITLEDAKKEFDDGTAIFIDTRPEDQYRQEHIKRAINIPAATIESRWQEIPTDKKIIAYCS